MENKDEKKNEEVQIEEQPINEERTYSDKDTLTDKMRDKPWVVSTIILGVVVLILLVSSFSGFTGSTITGGVVAGNDAGQAMLDFANAQGANATLVNVVEENNFYKITLSIQGQEIPIYVTKDGKYFTSRLIPLTNQESAQTQTSQPTEVPKSDKPTVELFVMSFCPFGNRAEKTMLPVYNLLRNKVDWNINYIVSVSEDSVKSLHGQSEVDEDIREVCIKNEYGLDKSWEFISYVDSNCGRDGSCWKTGAKQLGIDINKIQSCSDDEGIDLMKTEAQISGDAGVSGSPTLFINGVESSSVYQYENSEAYKQAICSAFNEPPEECNIELKSSETTASGGSCE